MNANNLSSRAYKLVKSAIAAAVLPIVVIYVMIAKPDYRIMNAMSHVVVPVAGAVGDLITWPLRVGGNTITGIYELSRLRTENEELRARLDAALANKNTCDIAIADNKRLAREINVVNDQNFESIVADVIHDNTAIQHNTFIINRGANDGVEPGMVAVAMDETLVGIIIDANIHSARVRALTDGDTNIAVRIVGSGVYGFLQGNGSSTPHMNFFSDPEFEPAPGIGLVSSNISGILPNDIYVGTMINDSDVRVRRAAEVSRVMILKFNDDGKYK